MKLIACSKALTESYKAPLFSDYDPSFPDPVRLAEALLFQSNGPLSRTMLARALGEDIEIAQIMSQVARSTEGLGFEIFAVGDGWMFRTAPDLAEPLTEVLEKPPERLPRAVLEVLLLIAARQPVTRPEIESFRDAALLQEKGLIRSVCRQAGPRPAPALGYDRDLPRDLRPKVPGGAGSTARRP